MGFPKLIGPFVLRNTPESPGDKTESDNYPEFLIHLPFLLFPPVLLKYSIGKPEAPGVRRVPVPSDNKIISKEQNQTKLTIIYFDVLKRQGKITEKRKKVIIEYLTISL